MKAEIEVTTTADERDMHITLYALIRDMPIHLSASSVSELSALDMTEDGCRRVVEAAGYDSVRILVHARLDDGAPARVALLFEEAVAAVDALARRSDALVDAIRETARAICMEHGIDC